MDGIGTSSWWISVVLVGLLVNLASAYLKARLDRFLSARSAKWEARSSKRAAIRKAKAEWFAGDDDEMADARWRVLLLLFLTSAGFIPTLPLILIVVKEASGLGPTWVVGKAIASVTFIVGVACVIVFARAAVELIEIIDEAQRIRRSERASTPEAA